MSNVESRHAKSGSQIYLERFNTIEGDLPLHRIPDDGDCALLISAIQE